MELSNYFYRTLVYTETKGQVSVYEKLPPYTMIPLEPWLGRVIQLADGQHTLQEMIEYIAGQYQGDVPENYLKTIRSVIERLLESEAIALSQTPHTLPYHLAVPKEQQDPQLAERSVKESGYTVQ